MAKLEKPFQICHRSQTALGKRVIPSVTPRESVALTGNNGYNLSGYSWEGGSGGKGFLGSPPPEGTIDAGYTKGYGDYRNDIRLISFDGSLDSGWNFTHEGKSKSQNYDQIYAYRSLRTEIMTFLGVGDSVWNWLSGGHVASSIIPVGGVSGRKGPDGLNDITIKSVSPNGLLGTLSLPPMPYILAKVANLERFTQAFKADNGFLPPPAPQPSPLPSTPTQKRISIQNQQGYLLQGQGQGGVADGNYVDPIMGFANQNRDDYVQEVGQLMQPIPANDLHVVNSLSSSRVICEWIANHIKINGKPISDTFLMEVLTGKDPEFDLLHYEASGSFNSAVQEAAQHGCWLAYWDSRAGFHFVPDTCSMSLKDILIAATVEDGPSMFGEIEVTLGTPSVRVNRVGVKGQPFLNFGDSTTDPMTNYFKMRIGRTWPVDTPPGQIGSDITFDNYMGKDMLEQARRLWAKTNRQTTLAWNNIPYPDMVMGMLGQVFAFKIRDPKGAFDWTNNDASFPYPELTYPRKNVYNPETLGYDSVGVGKLFMCVHVDGKVQSSKRNQDSWLCNAQFEEVIARP